MKITPREKRRHAAEREKNEGLQTKPKLLNLCVALTTLSKLDIITIYRKNNSTEQITRVALVEATKKKANPATDEIREENRNHGLA